MKQVLKMKDRLAVTGIAAFCFTVIAGAVWYFGLSGGFSGFSAEPAWNSKTDRETAGIYGAIADTNGLTADGANGDIVQGEVKLSGDKVTLVTSDSDNGDTNLSPTLSPSSTATPTSTKQAIVQENVGSIKSTVSPAPGRTPVPTPTPAPTASTMVSPETPIVTPTATPSPQLGTGANVVINEIAWMGTTTDANDEWIELYNPVANPVDLSGWTLKSLTGTSPDPIITLAERAGEKPVIEAFGYFLLERTNDESVGGITADFIYTGALGNSGEHLEIRDSAGNIVDFVDGSGGWQAGDNTQKLTMERKDSAVSGDSTGNWAESMQINGTPRQKNSVSLP